MIIPTEQEHEDAASLTVAMVMKLSTVLGLCVSLLLSVSALSKVRKYVRKKFS